MAKDRKACKKYRFISKVMDWGHKIREEEKMTQEIQE